MSAAVMGGSAQLSASRAAADVLIEPKLDGISLLSFKAFDKAVEAGYQAAMHAIRAPTIPRIADTPVLRMVA